MDLLTVLQIAGGVLAYLFIAGFTYPRALPRLRTAHRHGDGECQDCQFNAVLVAMFWAIAVPVLLGAGIGRLPDRKQARLERQRKEELEAQRHATELARLKREEARQLDIAIYGLTKYGTINYPKEN